MEAQSLGKLLPRVLFPYAQQWAERSGLTLLSRLLEDEQFRTLVEKYGDEFARQAASAFTPSDNENNRGSGSWPPSGKPNGREAAAQADDLMRLQDRVSAMEAQYEVQQAIFEQLRTKVRPLALALGCCPECFVGVEGCLKCGGRSCVGSCPPDQTLLMNHVVRPLVARGVPLSLKEMKGSGNGHQPNKSTTTTKEKKHARGNDRERGLGK